MGGKICSYIPLLNGIRHKAIIRSNIKNILFYGEGRMSEERRNVTAKGFEDLYEITRSGMIMNRKQVV